jgi:nucleoid-associated protein YgaU
MKKKKGFKLFKSSEETVSMFLGLAIVVVIAGLIFNFVRKNKGTVNVPDSKNSTISINEVKPEEPKVYVVMRNDSLWNIAKKEYGDGYSWFLIAKENNLKNPGILITGQKLIIPKIGKKDVVATINKETKTINKGEYKVVKGDNLWKISVNSYGDGYQWTKIWQENKKVLKNPGQLEIGITLNIPELKNTAAVLK